VITRTLLVHRLTTAVLVQLTAATADVADQAAEGSGRDVVVADAEPGQCRPHSAVEHKRIDRAGLHDVGGHAVDLARNASLLRQLGIGDLARHQRGERQGRCRLAGCDLVGRRNADDVLPRKQVRLMGLLDLDEPADGFELLGAFGRPWRALGEEVLPPPGEALARALLGLAPGPELIVHGSPFGHSGDQSESASIGPVSTTSTGTPSNSVGSSSAA